MPEDAILWRILVAARDDLKALSFVRMEGDTVDGINPNNIEIRKYSPGRQYESAFKGEDKPGIYISPALRMPQDPMAGENKRDDIKFPVMFQIVDKDDGDRQLNMRSYLKWQEQVWRYFMSQPLGDEDDDCLAYTSYFEMVDVLDERMWGVNDLFIAGVRIDFMARLTRGV